MGNLKDVSGMSYVGEGTFVTVHDMKWDEESTWPRVSLLQLPTNLSAGLHEAPITNKMINWPPRWIDGNITSGPNDLESVAGIPGKKNLALLCESTNSRKDTPLMDRIYLVDVTLKSDTSQPEKPLSGGIKILDFTNFSSFTYSNNVEATAVAKYEGGYLFMWGERNSTIIRWAELTLPSVQHPKLIIGEEKGQGNFGEARKKHFAWSNRPVVGLDVDEVTGEIYLVSSYDQILLKYSVIEGYNPVRWDSVDIR